MYPLMKNSWQIPALIPARAGSKGIAGKNLRSLGGRPLIAHAISNAKAARRISRVVVSTDSPEIAALARSRGAETPFLRPPELAGDESPMLGVVEHAFRALAGEAGAPPALALLQPTSPFLRPETIDRAVESFESCGAPLLLAVSRVRQHPSWMLVRRGEALRPFLAGTPPRRQDLEELFIPCGALYLYRRSYLEGLAKAAPDADRGDGPGEGSAWIEVGWPESLDIDEPPDLDLAAWVIERGLAVGESPRP
jgi:CMP-N-acetylneuraminic acid synthetase